MDKDPSSDSVNSPATPFQALGGESAVRDLVERFYDLMELLPEFAHLRHLHNPDLTEPRQRLFWFLCGWLGGPNHYVERFGHPMLRARHLHVPIGIQARDEWLSCMRMAMEQMGVQDTLRDRLQQSFFQTADWMRNQGVPR